MPTPRLTYSPSLNSLATRFTIRSRLSIGLRPTAIRLRLSYRSFLDPLFVLLALQNVPHEDPRRDHVIGIDGAGFDELLHLGNRDAAGRRHDRVEVSRGSPIREIAHPIALPRAHESEVGAKGRLEHVMLAVDQARLLALGDNRSVGRRREKSADSGAAGANALRKRTLRDEFDLELSAQILTFEFPVFADVGGNHLPHLTRFQQDADTEVVDAGVVADDRQV